MTRFYTLILLLCVALTTIASESLQQTAETTLSKEQLFNLANEFIADNWKNSKDAISFNDKEAGVIQLNSDFLYSKGVGMGLSCVYKYTYKVRFRVKDNKYRIEIYDIDCVDAKQTGLGADHEIPPIPYFEGEEAPEKTKKMGKGLNKKQAIEMMKKLRENFDHIFTGFNNSIQNYSDF